MCKTIRYACGHAEKSPCQRGLAASSSRPRPPRKKGFWGKLFSSPSTSSDRSCRAIDINKHHFCPHCEAAGDRLALNPRLSGPYHSNLHDEVSHLPNAGRSGLRQRDSRPLSADTAARLNALPGFYDFGDQPMPAPAASRTRSRNERAPPHPGPISESRARHPRAPLRERNTSRRPAGTDHGPVKEERYNLIIGRWEEVEPRAKPLPPLPATPAQQQRRDRHRNVDPAEVLQERYDMGTGLWESHDDSPLHHPQPMRPREKPVRNQHQVREVSRGRGQVYRTVRPLQPQEAVRGERSPALRLPRRATSPAPVRRHGHSNLTRDRQQSVQRPEVQAHRSNTLRNRHDLPRMSSSIGRHIDEVEQMWREAGKEKR